MATVSETPFIQQLNDATGEIGTVQSKQLDTTRPSTERSMDTARPATDTAQSDGQDSTTSTANSTTSPNLVSMEKYEALLEKVNGGWFSLSQVTKKGARVYMTQTLAGRY